MGNLLEGKICLVTGATRGSGKAICEYMAAEGALVYANERQEGTIASDSELIVPLVFDVTDVESVKRAVIKIKKEHGKLDVLVNNAGVEYNGLIEMVPEEHIKDMFNTNVFGVINMIQYCTRLLKKSDKASVINISSIVGLRGNSGQSIYSATKGAVNSLTKSLAKEFGEFGIRVNAVAPGLTNTEMVNRVDTGCIQNRINNISLGKIAEPGDIAKTCVYLASDLSEYVTGQIISVDGGSII